ncbi:MAG: prenyltransferase/squalene oxidase repeat-containing protein [Isosphaeraceae bacterium]
MMSSRLDRRNWIRQASAAAACCLAPFGGRGQEAGLTDREQGRRVAEAAREYILRCRRDDGSYAASPNPNYPGESDTKFSDLAAATYAAVVAKTMGWALPHPEQTVAFVLRHQQPDGRFVNQAGKHDPASDLAVLYNSTQGVVALRALGQVPPRDPLPVIGKMLEGDAYRKLPWYTTSFFPLVCAALDQPFPKQWREKLTRLMVESQAEDGYLGDHVASSVHMAHFFRLIGEPTPRAEKMVERVLRDQKPDGGWNIKEPDWDVHAAFDAVFILRQLAGENAGAARAISRGADWSLSCRNPDGGFGHFPGRPSDMDAVYFQLGTLIQAGRIPGARTDLPDSHTLGWGHAMDPAKVYRT